MFNFISFIFALSFFYKFDLIGSLYLSQLIIFVLFIYYFQKIKFVIFPKNFFIICLIFLLSQIISDIINSTEFNNYIRGWIKILITILSFITFFIIASYENKKIQIILFWIIFISLCFYSLIDFKSFEYSWKFGLANNFLILILLILSFKKIDIKNIKLIVFIIIISISFISLFFGARSTFLLSSILLFHLFLLKNNNNKNILKKIILFTPVLIFVILFFYNYIYTNFSISENLIRKYSIQTGDLGMFLGGRSELLASYKAIIDKPIWGHGSWASNCEYVYFLKEQLELYNYQKYVDIYNCRIPSHSVILGYWVEAGIFGFIFWLYFLNLIIKSYLIELQKPTYASPLKLFLIFLSIWDILFSPFGGTRMIILPLYLAIITSKQD